MLSVHKLTVDENLAEIRLVFPCVGHDAGRVLGFHPIAEGRTGRPELGLTKACGILLTEPVARCQWLCLFPYG